MSGEEKIVTEVPSSLKQLARLVVRGFYTIEDALIVDMLVRNPCKYFLDQYVYIYIRTPTNSFTPLFKIVLCC